MIEFLKFLQWIRKKYNFERNKFIGISIITIFISGALCVLLDINLPKEKWSNFVKLIPVLAFTLSTFITSYCLVKKTEKSEEQRANFTFRERVNLSIMIAIFLVSINLFLIDVNSSIYSITSASMLTIILWLLVFIRPFKYEIDKVKSEIEDEENDTKTEDILKKE